MITDECIVLDRDFIFPKYQPHQYNITFGRSGRMWLWGEVPNAADFIYIEASRRENAPGYRGFRGHGGNNIEFPVSFGTIMLRGPWHTNADALLGDTGLDLTDKYLSFVCIARKRTYDQYGTCIFEDIVWSDRVSRVGFYDRGESIALREAERLNETVYLFSQHPGGSRNIPIIPRGQIIDKEI